MKALSASLIVAGFLSASGFMAQAQDTPVASPGQSTQPSVPEIKSERETLKKDNAVVQEDKSKLAKDKSAGASKEQIQTDKKDLKQARRARHEMKKKLRAEKNLKMNDSVKQ